MAKARAKAQGGGSAAGAGVLVLLGLGSGVLLSYAPSVAVLLGLGLMPALLAWAFDTQPGRAGARAVAFCNLAALLPALAGSWRSVQHAHGGMLGLIDTGTLFQAWAGAAGGLLLWLALPAFAALAIDTRVRARRMALQRRRDALAEEWGEPE